MLLGNEFVSVKLPHKLSRNCKRVPRLRLGTRLQLLESLFGILQKQIHSLESLYSLDWIFANKSTSLMTTGTVYCISSIH